MSYKQQAKIGLVLSLIFAAVGYGLLFFIDWRLAIAFFFAVRAEGMINAYFRLKELSKEQESITLQEIKDIMNKGKVE